MSARLVRVNGDFLAVVIAIAVAGACVTESSAGGCSLSRAQGEGGIPLLVLENDFLRLTLSPEQGGACTSVVVKRTGEDLTEGGRDRKMFQEFVHGYKWDWIDAPYEYRVLRTAPEEIAVRLWKHGKQSAVRYCKFTKTIRIRSDSSAVHVDLEFLNDPRSMAPIHVPLRLFQSAEFSTKDTDFHLPAATGIKDYPYRKQGASQEIWVYDVPAAWMAATDPPGQEGFAYDIGPSYRRLMCLYCWLGSNGSSTSEWMLRTTRLAGGESLVLDYSFIPFHGVSQVAGVGGGMVTGFDGLDEQYAAEQPVALAVKAYFSEKRAGTLHLEALRLPDRASVVIGEAELRGEPDRVEAFDFAFSPPDSGTYVLAGVIRANGKTIHEFERPVVIGAASGDYAFRPKGERLGDPEERFRPGPAPLRRDSDEDPLQWTGGPSTPHVKWAKPYAGGTIRALVLCSYIQGREVLELAQRADLDVVTGTIETSGSNNWTPWWRHGGHTTFSQANMTRLLKGDYDVIVLGSYAGDIYTEEMGALLRRQVENGTGLVYVMPWRLPDPVAALLPGREVPGQPYGRPATKGRWSKASEHFLTQGIPFELLPETLYRRYEIAPGGSLLARVGEDPLIIAGEAEGGGRTVLLSYVSSYYGASFAGLTPWFLHPPPETFAFPEYYYALLARCVVWAAGREPDVAFEKIVAAAVAGGAMRLSIHLANRGQPFRGELEVAVHDRHGAREVGFSEMLSVAAGTSTAGVESPKGRVTAEGTHIARAILRRDGKVINWAAVPFQVTQPARIRSIEIPDKVFRSGDTVEASVQVETDAGLDLAVRADLIDSLGRIIRSHVVRSPVAVGAEIPFKLVFPEPLSTAHVLRVRLLSKDTLISEKQKEILALPTSFAERRWQDYEFAAWGVGPGENPHVFSHKAAAMRNAGLTTMSLSSGPKHYHADRGVQMNHFRHGFKLAPISFFQGHLTAKNYQQQKTAYAKTRDKAHLCRSPSLNDPRFLEFMRAETQRTLSPLVEFAPLGYCYNDESSLTRGDDLFDFDFSPEALDSFRGWLKQEYGTLERLNGQWETAFRQWREVMPMTMDEVGERANKSPWADHRAFMDKASADFYLQMRDVLREIDPKAVGGICGNQRPGASNGMNYAHLMETFDFLFPYIDSGLLEIERSLGHIPMAPCNGYGRPSEFLKYEAWVTFLHGSRGVFYYQLRFFLNPNLTPGRDARELGEIVRFLNKGLARLIGRATRQAQVAIHYSQASLRLSSLEMKQQTFNLTRVGWLDVIEDIGLQADFVTPEQIGGGVLSKYTTFVLPYSCSLSSREAEAIREFVKGGGLLLGDAVSGVYDEHGKPYREGLLDDVFGIHLGKGYRAGKKHAGDLTFVRDYKDCRVKGGTFYTYIIDRDLQVQGSQALGVLDGGPAFLVHSYGSGEAVYLNTFLTSYSNTRKRGREAPFRELMRTVFRLGGARAPAEVLGKKGALKVCQVVRFDAGPVEYVGILRDYRNPNLKATEGRIVFPDKRHLYDVREGKYLGLVDQARARLSPGEARVFARLDYQVNQIGARPASSFQRGAEVRYAVTLDTSGGVPGFHVVHVEVRDSAGKLCRHYSRNVNVTAGRGEGAFTLARSDPGGQWPLTLRDAATGVTAETTFSVVP